MRNSFLIAGLLISVSATAQHLVDFRISALPSYHPAESAVYAAGSFNGWNPKDENYRFTRNTDSSYHLAVNLPEGDYEFKLTRGSWQTVECKKAGTPTENRRLKVSKGSKVEINVEEWADRFPAEPKKSTASPQVCVLDTNFVIPQLKRTRRVWIYLPPGYCDTRDKYPVLYLQDGQNVFDEATSFSGEWGIDEFMDSTTLRKCIVVGVDHGNDKRLTEYNPYDHKKFGKGEGDLYADFLVNTLKPYIDKHYRTLRGRQSTFISGSSMGGLISLYTVLRHPKVFGAAGIFSPALWVAGEGIFDDIRKNGPFVKTNLYFYGGKLEGETMVPDMLRAHELLSEYADTRMTTVIRDEGKHDEPTWRKEFPLFYEWIMRPGKRRSGN